MDELVRALQARRRWAGRCGRARLLSIITNEGSYAMHALGTRGRLLQSGLGPSTPSLAGLLDVAFE